MERRLNMKNYLILLLLSLQGLCASEENQLLKPVASVKNTTAYPIKVQIEYHMSRRVIFEKIYSVWQTIQPAQVSYFYIPKQFVKWVRTSELRVRVAHKPDRAILTNKLIRLNKAALDQAVYQVKLKNNNFTVNRKRDRPTT
jgi:hypothetical protein